MSLILTTPYERRSHVWIEWEGEPFSEQRLDAAVAAFHRALADPAIDPRPLGRRLYALMLAPFEAELRADGVELVLLSLDRRLRYVPVAALYDGERFAAERFAFSTLTNAGYEIAGERVSGVPVAALGMTQAADGFNALPGVGIELDGLVRGDDGFGLMEGRVLLDAAFDRIALEDALLIGADGPAGMGVVHISSHFHLGRSDDQSFLLLGTGERLALDEIKGDGFAFDFAHVDLLTLSACSTGYANPALDGRELESLAYITGDRGARAILASLWPVEDRMTAILMQRFYELRERGGYSKARAMALAQREFITGRIGSRDHFDGDSIVFETAIRGAVSLAGGGRPDPHGLGRGHPFYWAPFVLTGNWR